MKENNVRKIFDILSEEYPDAKSGLNYDSTFQLLIAVMLSAQCTDKRVNEVTKILFKKMSGPEECVLMGESSLGEIIKPCGLYRTKSRNIVNTCRILLERFNGEVPDRFEDLVKLPGVGRKSANVILIEAYRIPAIPVDTHVHRVSNRIGFAKAKNPEMTEMQLMKAIPEDMWIKMHHLIINHGRKVCISRRPKCEICKINCCCGFTKRKSK